MEPSQTPKETFLKDVIQDVTVYHREQDENILRSVEKEWTIIGKDDIGTRCNCMIDRKLNSVSIEEAS